GRGSANPRGSRDVRGLRANGIGQSPRRRRAKYRGRRDAGWRRGLSAASRPARTRPEIRLMKYRISRRADKDVAAICNHVAEDNPMAAEQLDDRLHQEIQFLAQFPGI